MSAHNCPFDHRSLQYYARMKRREDELVTLSALNQRDPLFKGPYQVRHKYTFYIEPQNDNDLCIILLQMILLLSQVPSTSIFNKFHKLLRI